MSLKNLDLAKIKLPLDSFERNGLQPVLPATHCFDVFTAVANQTFQPEGVIGKIKQRVLDWLMEYFDNEAFPAELAFLKDTPGFFEVYQYNQTDPAFDTFNLLLCSLCFQATFELLFVPPTAKNFISTTFNPGCGVTVYFFAQNLFQTRSFFALRQVDLTPVQRSLHQKWSDKILDDLESDPDPLPLMPTPSDPEALAKLGPILRKHLSTFEQLRSYHIEVEAQQKILQSAQKEVLPVFSFETRSIAKTGNPDQQRFDFSAHKVEEKNKPPASLTAASLEPDFFINRKPPGLFSDQYQSNVIVFGKQAEPKPDSSHNTPNKVSTARAAAAGSKRRVFTANTHPDLDRTKRHVGRMQNFYTDRGYGFIVIEGYPHNIFVHFDDLQRGGVTTDMLRKKTDIQISFEVVSYPGNGNLENVKATNVELIRK